MICENADKCNKDCPHNIPHKQNIQCNVTCKIVNGVADSKCIEYKEEPVIQKLEELADQTAKKDAGKLRYDLIEGDMLPDSARQYPFDYLKPGALRLNDINKAIDECFFIIGSYDKLLEELAKVYTFGCKKYSEKSWQSVPNGRIRYEAAIFRHIKDYKNGDWTNWTDGGCLHVAQIAWNLIAVKWFIVNGKTSPFCDGCKHLDILPEDKCFYCRKNSSDVKLNMFGNQPIRTDKCKDNKWFITQEK